MKGNFNGLFLGRDSTVDFHGVDPHSYCDASFQELDAAGTPIKGKYIIARVWDDKLLYLKDLKVGDKVKGTVEIDTRRNKKNFSQYFHRMLLLKIEPYVTNYDYQPQLETEDEAGSSALHGSRRDYSTIDLEGIGEEWENSRDAWGK